MLIKSYSRILYFGSSKRLNINNLTNQSLIQTRNFSFQRVITDFLGLNTLKSQCETMNKELKQISVELKKIPDSIENINNQIEELKKSGNKERLENQATPSKKIPTGNTNKKNKL